MYHTLLQLFLKQKYAVIEILFLSRSFHGNIFLTADVKSKAG
jgi:uncharacterized sporulation protein YeaH/YhbH (DUF444 family)